LPLETDLARVERILSADRAWSGYALADLDPGLREHCRWHAFPDRDDALLLVFSPFQPAVLFALGDAEALRSLIPEIPSGAYSLSVRPDFAQLLSESGFETRWRKRMLRMALPVDDFAPSPSASVEPLTPNDLAAVQALFADGEASGEKPDFFFADMLRTGVYCGVREGDQLAAVAGTHLCSQARRAAGVGNVYVRRDRRGQGLGRAVASAVVQELRRREIETIVLNVEQANQPARRVYQRLGFRLHCEFVWSEVEKP